MQMDMESYFINLAMQEEGDSIIFTDRGYLDNFAYCTEKVRDIILAETGWTLDLLSNHAYDAVFHLVTAADGAEHAYTTANNAARTETAETARWQDKITQKAWITHSNHVIIDNSGDGFDSKMNRLYNAVAPMVGLAAAPHFVKKFLLEPTFNPEECIPKDIETTVHSEKIDYLVSEDAKVLKWVKERHNFDTGTYSWTFMERHLSVAHEERMELKRKITERMWLNELSRKDPNRETLQKKYHTFIDENVVFMIEQYEMNGEPINVLRVYTDTEDLKARTLTPSYIKCVKDISEDSTYFQCNLAMKKNPDDK